MTAPGPAVLDRAFRMLVACAVAGERCPFSDSIPGGSPTVGRLARQGKVFVEIYLRNFRRVTILEGEARGKTTADPPRVHGKLPRPYLTVGRVTLRNGVPVTGPWHVNRPTMMFKDGVRIK